MEKAELQLRLKTKQRQDSRGHLSSSSQMQRLPVSTVELKASDLPLSVSLGQQKICRVVHTCRAELERAGS